ncbi:cytochrome oxidase putative small subunit CydP [Paraherbaspirillum soli]|uniref:Cytochrome oxidase putative small subunit CydP n=1 Tax=Paraherbaspirillum soli TaxID=631222 RepID=A0ABW0M9W6_9BURK
MPSFTLKKRLTRLPLALEIGLILIVKIALLTLLWKAFFSEPQTKKMRMPTAQVEQHLLTSQAVAPASLPSYPTSRPEAPHDSH